jgi:hypothetical protein
MGIFDGIRKRFQEQKEFNDSRQQFLKEIEPDIEAARRSAYKEAAIKSAAAQAREKGSSKTGGGLGAYMAGVAKRSNQIGLFGGSGGGMRRLGREPSTLAGSYGERRLKERAAAPSGKARYVVVKGKAYPVAGHEHARRPRPPSGLTGSMIG